MKHHGALKMILDVIFCQKTTLYNDTKPKLEYSLWTIKYTMSTNGFFGLRCQL